MKEHYSHVAAFAEACRGAAITMVEHLEKSRPKDPITPASLRPLRRLYTPEARLMVLTHVPTHACTLHAFSKAVDLAEKAQWVAWHWDQAPESHVHAGKKADVLLRNALAKATPTAALKTHLGGWSQSPMPGGSMPPWHLLAKAKLWTDVQFAALRRQLASPPSEWRIGDAQEDMLTLFPRQDTTASGGLGVVLGRRGQGVFRTQAWWMLAGRLAKCWERDLQTSEPGLLKSQSGFEETCVSSQPKFPLPSGVFGVLRGQQ